MTLSLWTRVRGALAALGLLVGVGAVAPESDVATCVLTAQEMTAKVDAHGIGSPFIAIDVKVSDDVGGSDSAGTFLRRGTDNTTLQFQSLGRYHFITPTNSANWFVAAAGLCSFINDQVSYG
jgi:hypothetical protein